MRPLVVLACLAAPALAEPRVDAHGDPLPDGAITRFGTVRFRVGTEKTRYAHALSPDGARLAVDDGDGIRLWDTETGRVAQKLPWRTSQGDFPKFALAFSPDGKRLARMAGRVVAVWDLATTTEVFDVDYKEEGKLHAIRWGPGKDELTVTSDEDWGAWTLDATTGRKLRTVTFPPPKKYPYLIPTGTGIVGHAEDMWYLFDQDTGEERGRFAGTKGNEALVPSPDGKKILHLSEAGRLRTIAGDTGKVLEDLDPPAGWPGKGRPRLALSADGSVAFLSQGHRIVHRRDLVAGKWLANVPNVPADELLPHPDGKRLLAIGPDGLLRRFDLTTLKPLPEPDSFADPVFAYPSPNGQRIVIDFGETGSSNRLMMFDAKGKLLWAIDPSTEEWGVPHWSPDGRRLACVRSNGIRIRDAANGDVLRTLSPGDRGPFDWARYSTGGERLLALVGGREVVAFDPVSGDHTTLRKLDDEGLIANLSPDCTLALTWSQYSVDRMRLYDVTAGRLIGEPLREPADCRPPADMDPRFSPDGSCLITWELEPQREPWRPRSMVAIIRDPRTGARQRAIAVDRTGPFEWAMSSDGLVLAIGTRGGSVELFDVPTGAALGQWDGHKDSIVSIQFAGPGRIVTGSADRTALLWDLRPKQRPTKPVWDALTGADGKEAWRAMWALAADPKVADLLRTKATVFGPPPADQVKRWIADLGADKFAAREEATKQLQALGRRAESALRAARAETKSEEVRTRLDGLLAKISPERTADEWAQARAVAALEAAGSPEARKLLAEWSAGDPGMRLTIGAKAALMRLGSK